MSVFRRARWLKLAGPFRPTSVVRAPEMPAIKRTVTRLVGCAPCLGPTGQLFAAACLGQLERLSPLECELVLSAISYASSGVFQSRPREAQLSAKSNSDRIAAARKSRGPE